MRRMSIVLAAVALAGVFLVASPAQAGPIGATASSDGGDVLFLAKPGFANRVTVTPSSGKVEFDDIVEVTPSGQCTYPDAADHTRVSCVIDPAADSVLTMDVQVHTGDLNDVVIVKGSYPGTYRTWVARLGAGHDTLDASASPAALDSWIVQGGPGDDVFVSGPTHDQFSAGDGMDTLSFAGTALGVTVAVNDPGSNVAKHGGPTGVADAKDEYYDVEALIGGSGNDVLIGASGNDRLSGGPGWDKLIGNAGDDWLLGGTGGDKFWGGSGVDTASYLAHPGPVTVDLGQPYGGMTGEMDSYDSIENISGSSYDDVLVGDGKANVLAGDTCGWLCLGGGADKLYGGGGDDTLSGDDGADSLYGGTGFDALDGGTGADACYPEGDGGTKANCELPLAWP